MPGRSARVAALALLSICLGLAAPAAAAGRSPLVWGKPKSVDPLRGRFLSVSCVGKTFCLAGDANGKVLRFDGRKWSPQAVLGSSGDPVSDIACVTTSFCAAGLKDELVTYRDGRWHARHAGPAEVGGVDCVSVRFCLAVNENGTYQRYDGASWTGAHRFAPHDSLVTAVSCASPRFCIAVDREWVYRYNGSSWSSAQRVDPDQFLQAASCPKRSWCLAVDGDEHSFRLSHGRWHSLPATTTATPGYTSVDCVAVGRCTAVDWRGRAQRYAHGTWRDLHQVVTGKLLDVSCPNWHSCVAVSYLGQAAAMTSAGWQPRSRPDPLVGFVPEHDRYAQRGLSCSSAHSCVALDSSGAWLHYDGSSWTKPKRISSKSYGTFERPLSCPSATFCMALVNDENTRVLRGARWSKLSPVPVDSWGLSCESARRCIALSGINAQVWNGSRWHIAHRTSRDDMVTISCTRSFCVAGTADGSVVTYRDGRWSAPHRLVDLHDGPGLGVSCTRAAFCLAYVRHGPHAGVAFQRISGTWSAAGRAFRGDSTLVRALSCSTRSLCVATSDDSVSSYDGHAWTRAAQIAPKKDGVLSAISCAGRSLCVAMTDDGHAVLATR